MKALVQHLWNSNREEIVSRSLLHCHTPNVHSIMLLECPGKTIRLFVATREHGLYTNTFPCQYPEPQSVAFHPHHCDISLVAVTENVTNWVSEEHDHGMLKTRKYRYKSGITQGEATFEYEREAYLVTPRQRTLCPMLPTFMPAEQIHTMSVPKGEEAAWFVFEGKENPGHEPVAYSKTDPGKQLAGLYKPMTETEIEWTLQGMGLL